jgi:ankyrin repeat-containing protein
LALDKHLSEGFDIEEDIKLGKYTRLSPLGLALNKCQLCSVLYFVYKYSL